MSRAPVNNYVDNLQRQIADIAAKIKQKHQKKNDDFADSIFELRIKSSAVQNQAYKLVDSQNAYSILGQNSPANSEYVTETYNMIANSDKKSTIIDGLDFKNNKEFDFKV